MRIKRIIYLSTRGYCLDITLNNFSGLSNKEMYGHQLGILAFRFWVRRVLIGLMNGGANLSCGGLMLLKKKALQSELIRNAVETNISTQSQ